MPAEAKNHFIAQIPDKKVSALFIEKNPNADIKKTSTPAFAILEEFFSYKQPASTSEEAEQNVLEAMQNLNYVLINNRNRDKQTKKMKTSGTIIYSWSDRSGKAHITIADLGNNAYQKIKGENSTENNSDQSLGHEETITPHIFTLDKSEAKKYTATLTTNSLPSKNPPSVKKQLDQTPTSDDFPTDELWSDVYI